MVLAINQLQVSYHQQTILHGVDLNVAQGEIVCLLGSSGCGKTTLLKTIAGLTDVDKGEIEINGNTVNSDHITIAPEHRNLGMLFQDYALFPHLTVHENIAYGLRRLSKKKRNIRVQDMLALVQLPNISDKYPNQLSGGQQQRVALARALAYQPDLLLLDEPFSNIDTKVKFELIAQIRDIIKQSGVAAIFVSHSKDEAYGFADTIALMDEGKIQQTGSPQQLYQQPNSLFVARFMGPLNEIKRTQLPQQATEILAQKQTQPSENDKLFVRPESLSLAPIVDQHNVELQAVVESTTFYGKQVTVTARCYGEVISFYTDSQQHLASGDKVNLYFSTEHLLLAD
ncbi:ABC transporter ATP-binding protein [Thalassotalea mangrovi]|uniref:ABC transporter ATP-binding protein n=1 Tax=Thalassotalea mangrovi TaxID=2572245 RepID=UPI00145DB2F1|nr:ABC transporter ATP-binding protein [Thalassotalea mangrovi]